MQGQKFFPLELLIFTQQLEQLVLRKLNVVDFDSHTHVARIISFVFLFIQQTCCNLCKMEADKISNRNAVHTEVTRAPLSFVVLGVYPDRISSCVHAITQWKGALEIYDPRFLKTKSTKSQDLICEVTLSLEKRRNIAVRLSPLQCTSTGFRPLYQGSMSLPVVCGCSLAFLVVNFFLVLLSVELGGQHISELPGLTEIHIFWVQHSICDRAGLHQMSVYCSQWFRNVILLGICQDVYWTSTSLAKWCKKSLFRGKFRGKKKAMVCEIL